MLSQTQRVLLTAAVTAARQQQQQGIRQFTSSRVLSRLPPAPNQNLLPSLTDAGHVHLRNRTVVNITGSDAADFLQGLVTQDISMPKLEELAQMDAAGGVGRRQLFTTAFLNVRGRLRHDAFVYRYIRKNKARFYVDVDSFAAADFVRYIRQLKMRARVMVEAVDQQELSAFAAWDHPVNNIWVNPASLTWRPPSANFPDESLGLWECYRDLRAPNLGWRILGKPEEVLASGNLPGRRQTMAAWDLRRYMCGVPEGHNEIFFDSVFPTECNYDFIGGLDFNKECFVGQEITHRRRYQNVVGKRIVPVQLHEALKLPAVKPDDIPIYEPSLSVPRPTIGCSVIPSGPTGRRQSGKFIQSVGNIGLAICDLDTMLGALGTDEDYSRSGRAVWHQIKDPIQGNGLYLRPFVVPWLRNLLQKNNSRKQKDSLS